MGSSLQACCQIMNVGSFVLLLFSFCIYSIIILHLPSVLQPRPLQHHTQANLFARWKPRMQGGEKRKAHLSVSTLSLPVRRGLDRHQVLLCRNNPLFLMPSCFSLEYWNVLSFGRTNFWGKKK